MFQTQNGLLWNTFIWLVHLTLENEMVLHVLYSSCKSQSEGWEKRKELMHSRGKNLFLESIARYPKFFGSQKSGVKTIY